MVCTYSLWNTETVRTPGTQNNIPCSVMNWLTKRVFIRTHHHQQSVISKSERNYTRLYHVFLGFIIYYCFQSKENNSVIKSFKGSNVKVSSIFQQLLFNNGDGGTSAVKFRSGEKIFLFISWVHKDQRRRGGEYMQFSSGRLCLR